MFEKTYLSHSEEETKNLAKKLALTLKGGDIVLLYGDLGAGKTTFVKGLASACGMSENNITSPTFILMNVHPIKSPTKALPLKILTHIDTYRLKTEQELIDIGVEDYLAAPDSLCVIEWPEKMNTLLKRKKIISIFIEHLEKNQRRITLKK